MADYSVFTKPWRELSVPDLIRVVSDLGYNAIEFPLRDGFQVTPDQARDKLPQLVKDLKSAGIRVDDVASAPEERIFSACAEAGIPMIRVMFNPPAGDYLRQEKGYLATVESWLPLCEKYGVKVGIQMHHGRGAMTTADMMRVVGQFDSRYIGAIWDAAHSALAGENVEQAIDVCWSHLCLANFKNARYQMYGRAADGAAVYKPYFCPGSDGQLSWPRAVKHLKEKGYAGTWCMPAEYTGLTPQEEIDYARRDLAWLKSLVEGEEE